MHGLPLNLKSRQLHPILLASLVLYSFPYSLVTRINYPSKKEIPFIFLHSFGLNEINLFGFALLDPFEFKLMFFIEFFGFGDGFGFVGVGGVGLLS